MKASDHLVFQKTRGLALAMAFLSLVGSGCVSYEARVGILGMLRPQKYLEREGFFLVQPYDRKKIPIVFVHGLMAIPHMWLPVMAALESDPVLRGRFQLLVFADPTAYSALRLRQALESVYEICPRSQDMVIINYSLGGDLTHLQVINTGDALIKGIFKNDAPRIMAELPADSLVKQALIFKANSRIKRVVFICAPHRGAPLASNQIGAFGARLIQLPGKIVTGIGSATLRAATSAAAVKGAYLPNSIHGLEPNSPRLLSMNTVPIGENCTRGPHHCLSESGGHQGDEAHPASASQDRRPLDLPFEATPGIIHS